MNDAASSNDTHLDDSIIAAYRHIHAEKPSAQEIKDTRSLIELSKTSGMDPFIILDMRDAKNRDLIRHLPNVIKEVVETATNEMDVHLKERVAEILKAIPNGSQTRTDLSALNSFKERMASAEHTAQTITDLVLKKGTTFLALVALIVAAVTLAIVFFTFRFSYAAGLSQSENAYACQAIVNMHEKAMRDRHIQTARDLDDDYNIRTCAVKVVR